MYTCGEDHRCCCQGRKGSGTVQGWYQSCVLVLPPAKSLVDSGLSVALFAVRRGLEVLLHDAQALLEGVPTIGGADDAVDQPAHNTLEERVVPVGEVVSEQVEVEEDRGHLFLRGLLVVLVTVTPVQLIPRSVAHVEAHWPGCIHELFFGE